MAAALCARRGESCFASSGDTPFELPGGYGYRGWTALAAIVSAVRRWRRGECLLYGVWMGSDRVEGLQVRWWVGYGEVVLHGRGFLSCLLSSIFVVRVCLLMSWLSRALGLLKYLRVFSGRISPYGQASEDAQPFARLEQLGSWNCRRCFALTAITRPR